MLDDLDSMLDEAITAHEAKDFNSAAAKYTKILERDAHHADANHNFGLLTVELGLKDEALIFLQTAINTNPKVLQYWVTFIDTLTNVERFDDAKSVLEQAHLFGFREEIFDQLRHNLDLKRQLCEPLIELERVNPAETVFDQVGQKLGVLNEPITGSKKSEQDQTSILGELKLDQALKLAKKKIKDGEYEEAKVIYEDILKKFSKNKKALEGVKSLSDKLNSKKTIIQEPPQNQTRMVFDLYKQGLHQEAADQTSELLKEFPNSVSLYNILGAANQGLGKLDEAAEAFQKALSINPNNHDAYSNLGNILRDTGKLEEAIAAFKKALSLKPDYAEAYYNMGNALKDQGKQEDAIEAYKRAITIKPNFPRAHNNMGNQLRDQGKLEEAIEAYNAAILINPRFADAYSNLGNALRDKGNLDKAIEAFRTAISINPGHIDAYYNMANTLKDNGQLEKAAEAYNTVITLNPNYTDAHRNMSAIKKYVTNDPQLKQVENLFKSEGLTDDAKCNLGFTLHKMYDDLGDLSKAFAYLSEGNALRKKVLRYSINQDESLFNKLIKVAPTLKRSSLKMDENYEGPKPIFILGMPRSGTTLVEQIIASHYDVTGAGELGYLAQWGHKLSLGFHSINTESLFEFRKRYLLELEKLSLGKNFITDKMPQNFRFIPLIFAAMPEAKVIHVKRSAAATCWSNYKQYFPTEDLGYCYDLNDVVSYYKLYADLMERWQDEYGGSIYNLRYEKLTTDTENETRKLIKHLTLNWDKACLSPHKNNRSIRTASQQQVRQKIYQGSSNSWRKYDPFLRGVFDSLSS